MKKLFFTSLVFAAFTLVVSSCSKSSDSSSSSSSYSMTATVNGSAWSATNVTATENTIGGNDNLSITGLTSSNSTITLSIIGYSSPTTYSISPGSNGGMYSVSGTSGLTASISGSITITSKTTTAVQGTFSFTCMDSTKVTSGTFTAKML